MLVAVLFSRPVNGTRRWFGIGGFGVQPSELAKLTAIFFTALILERRRERINELGYALLPIALIVGGLTGLILLEPDYGTAVSLLAVIAVMVFAAGVQLSLLPRRRAADAAGAVRHPRFKPSIAGAACWRSWIRGPIRLATAFRSSSR